MTIGTTAAEYSMPLFFFPIFLKIKSLLQCVVDELTAYEE